MKKIKIVCSTLLCLSLVACSNNYERDTSKGSIEELTYEDFQQKIKDKENFLVVTSQTSCGHCQRYLAALKTYVKEHNITVYDINLAIQKKDVYTMFEEFPKLIEKHGKSNLTPFEGTPYTMVIEEGSIVDAYSGPFTYEDEEHEEWDYTMDEFDDIVTQYRLDEKH